MFGYFRWARVSTSRSIALLLLLTALAVSGAGLAHAQARADGEPTKLMIRALAHDAKLLQTPVGGARITVRNAETGAVLVQGEQQGDSGSTPQIMRSPHERGEAIFDTPGAAGYLATLMLDRPTRVRITAEGPLDYPQAMQSASTTIWMVPGQDVVGDGVVLELHGFIVEVLTPSETEVLQGERVDVRARVRMLCGCPTEPGGLWDASRYTITAQLLHDGEVVAEAPMDYAGTTSEYEAELMVPEGGATTVRVLAADAERANFGVATQPITVR